MYNKDPPPSFSGKDPTVTWQKYKKSLQMWLKLTDYPPNQRGQKVLDALSGSASELIEWWSVEDLTAPDAAIRIFEELSKAYDHLTTHEAQKDFEAAVSCLQRNRTE